MGGFEQRGSSFIEPSGIEVVPGSIYSQGYYRVPLWLGLCRVLSQSEGLVYAGVCPVKVRPWGG
jgi:hypothetical protein